MEGSLYAVLGAVLVAGVGGLVLFLRGLKQGAAVGEAKERAREAIGEIREAVERGDDADIQRRLEEKIRGGR